MATIKTAIALYDGVTAPLRSMNKAINIVLNSFEAMQSASSRAIDTSAIRDAREELAKAATAFDSIEQNIRDAESQQKRFNNQIKGGTSAAGGLWDKLKSVASVAAIIAGGKKVLNISDQFTNTNARLNNAMIQFDDGGSLQELEQKVMASAQRSRTGYMDAAASIAKLGLNAKDAFGSMDEVIAFQELINKQFVIGGANTQEQQAAMVQLTQAMASGVLRGEELNSVFEQAPGIVQSIADYLDVPIGQIRNMAAEGQITSTIVKNAMFAASDEIEAKFERMPMTWSQIWTSMKNKALSIFAPILSRINEIGNSAQFNQVVDGLINGLAGVAQMATWVFELFLMIASVVIDNWSWIAPIILGVAAAYAVLKTILFVYNTIQTISNTLSAISAARSALSTGATLAQAAATTTATGAQIGLNTALMACPLTWIIILIIALIAIIYAVCAAIARFTGIANSGFGVICGGIMVVISFFKNLGLSVANIALGIWNALSACCSNIGTAFHNVIANVQGWFYNLLSTALNVVAGICEGLNKLPFIDFDYSGITNKANEYAAKSAEAYGSTREFRSVSDAFNEGMSTYDAFESGWASDAYKSGASWGDGVADSVSGFFDFSSMDKLGAADGLSNFGLTDAYNMGNTLDGIYNNTGDTAGNTAAMNDSLEISEDDLEYLRDIAEREAINRFTTAEVRIDMGGITNHLASNMDLDGVVNALGERLAEEVLVSAEGVHA